MKNAFKDRVNFLCTIIVQAATMISVAGIIMSKAESVAEHAIAPWTVMPERP